MNYLQDSLKGHSPTSMSKHRNNKSMYNISPTDTGMRKTSSTLSLSSFPITSLAHEHKYLKVIFIIQLGSGILVNDTVNRAVVVAFICKY